MLKLRRLELSGFKSFVDDTALDFAPGITAIVGPNGCGKSNLADAISWVLGEQSAKSLRSDIMEDVIFDGAEGRQPLGMAEVELTLETDPAFEHAEDGRLTIGRRVYRGGQGVYRLNGKRVRLKDIRDLLMDTGLGTRSYSIIEQGKVGLILSGKPQERRKLLEEAAGVTRYKERRRIAELKLEDAVANLHRLDDILSEVERSLRSLKRQAGAARRYREAQERHEELLKQVLLVRWHEIHGRQSALRQRLQRQTDEEASAAVGLAELEAGLAEQRRVVDETSDEVSRLHDRDAGLAARIEGRQEFVRGGRDRLAEIIERLAAGQRSAETHREEIERAGEERQRLEERRRELIAELESGRERVADDESALAARGSSLTAAASEVERLRSRGLEAARELGSARDDLHALEVEAEKAELHIEHLETEMADHAEELAEARAREREAAERVDELERTLESEIERRQTAGEELEEVLARETELTHRRQAALAELTELERRQELLAELDEAQRRDRSQIAEVLADTGLDEPRFLSELVSPPEGWERAVDHHLGPLVDAVVLPLERTVTEIADLLTEVGHATILLAPSEDPSDRAPISDPAIVGELGRELGLEPSVAVALPPAYLVRDGFEDAVRLAREHPGIAFIARPSTSVTNGVVRTGGSGRQPGALERRQELEELRQRRPPLERRVGQLTTELEETVTRRTEQAQVISGLESEIADLQRRMAVARARHEDTAARIRHLEREGERYETERETADGCLDELRAERSGQAQQVERLERRHRELEEELELALETLDELRSEREDLRTSEASRRGRVELFEERLRATEFDLERLERRVEEAEEAIAHWKDEESELQRRHRELESAVEEAERELGEALERRAGSQEALRTAREELEEKRQQIRALEGRAREARTRLDAARTALEATKVELAGVAQDAEHVVASFREHFDRDLPRPPEEPVAPLDALEEELVACRETLERLGPVNLLAAEEHAEQKARHAELGTQRADVAASVERLRTTIRDIDRTSNERFAATFEEVNRHFGRVFERLFAGGEAEMRLLDEENVLESGLEIVARPPGKRLQNMMLLSGGEKALTAIALLFALFHTKPSPFCILDEVDAALDEANTARFVEVLQEMANETQFIVVTHNKLTMQAASTLYGVTMQERGVSTTVSVALDDVQPESELATA